MQRNLLSRIVNARGVAGLILPLLVGGILLGGNPTTNADDNGNNVPPKCTTVITTNCSKT